MKFRKIAALTLVTVLVFRIGISALAAAEIFRDVDASYWAYVAIQWAFSDRAVVGGCFSDGGRRSASWR